MDAVASLTHKQEGERLELRITISGPRREADLRVMCSSTDRVRALTEAAANKLEAGTGHALWCERRRLRLDPDALLGESGIRWGDRLLLDPPASEPTRIGGGAAVVELAVISGPASGERFDLGAGEYVLGRDPQGDVVIADPSLSRHHLDVMVDETQLRLADAGSANGTALNGEALTPGSFVTVREHDDLQLGRTILRVSSCRTTRATTPSLSDGRIAVNRPPRVTSPGDPYERQFKAPPSRARGPRLPLAASLLPLAAGVLLFVLLKSPVMLAVAALTPLMALSTFFSDRRGGKKSYAREAAEFRAELKRALAALDEALAAETEARRAEAPDATAVLARARELASTLWERRPTEEDFLRLRIGVADLPARSSLVVKDGGERELQQEVEAALSGRRLLSSVPLTVDAAGAGVIGLVGPPASVSGLSRWLLLQAAVLHSPGELVVMAALTRTSMEDWAWLKWLPHLRPDRVGLDADAVLTEEEQIEGLLSDLRELAAARRKHTDGSASDPQARPAHVLVLVEEDAAPARAVVERTLMEIEGQGITLLWLGRRSHDLPGRTGAIVELDAERAVLSLTDVATGEVVPATSAEGVSGELAAETARTLAPLRDAGELARAGDIPKRVGLLDLLDLVPPSAVSLAERWARWNGSLAATVGVGVSGPLTLELRSEGPHALIAGTTGSGKSELLRTLVASLSAMVPPNRLSFLLIDYKGGAAFAPCAILPHVVDVVSDLDEHLAERALISLDAELKRRERILAHYGVDSLIDLERDGSPDCPANLVIAVDEFAKLRDEVPKFVDGVVDIAQRGRTLGVHMVLAAQTLRNAFTQAIRVNVNIKLALRVADEGESEDVIESPLAARIPSGERMRGRAFVRTGHDELREFQAAYVSGHSLSVEGQLEVLLFELGHQRRASGARDTDDDGQSDLVLLGHAAQDAQARLGLADPLPPWLPPLPTVLDLTALDAPGDGGVAIGLLDLPHLQRQEALGVNLDTVGHLAIFGAGNSGKTTALAALALSLARDASPEKLCLYGLDAGGGGLGALESLPHCAGIVPAHDAERVERLMRLLALQVARHSRETQRGRAGVGARTVLLLDDLGSFAQQYDRPGLDSPFERLGQVLAGGRAAGVHVALTASRRGVLPPALGVHFGQRLALRMNNEEDMLALGLEPKAVRGAKLPPGRGFTQDSQEFQIGVVVVDGTPVALADAAAQVEGERSDAAISIGVLPDAVSRTSLGRTQSLDSVPLGISDVDLAVATVDLSTMHLLVVGPYRSGRSTALATLARSITDPLPVAELYLLAPRRSPLRELQVWKASATSAEECDQLLSVLLERHEAGELGATPAFLFVDDGGEISSARGLAVLEQLVRAGRDSELRVIAAVETGASRGIGIAWIRELRREGHGLLLAPDLATDGDLLGAPLPRRLSTQMVPGRGFLVVRGAAELVQVAS
jgi:DNA segregation ATPase FtsK/SpoIIIE, S-DNA-T family